MSNNNKNMHSMKLYCTNWKVPQDKEDKKSNGWINILATQQCQKSLNTTRKGAKAKHRKNNDAKQPYINITFVLHRMNKSQRNPWPESKRNTIGRITEEETQKIQAKWDKTEEQVTYCKLKHNS